MARNLARSSVLLKWLIPILLIASQVVFALVIASSGHAKRDAMFFVVPIFAIALGLLFFRKMTWDLMDSVEDHGNYLLARRGRIEDRVELGNVMNINMSQMTNPPRLTLRLREAGKFGDEIAFIPKTLHRSLRLTLFARNDVAEELIRRVDRARMTSRAP